MVARAAPDPLPLALIKELVAEGRRISIGCAFAAEAPQTTALGGVTRLETEAPIMRIDDARRSHGRLADEATSLALQRCSQDASNWYMIKLRVSRSLFRLSARSSMVIA